MAWLNSEKLSMLVALALIFGLLYLMTDEWVRLVLMFASVAFVVVPISHRVDYGLRILMLATLGLLASVLISVYWSRQGGSSFWWVKAFTVGFAATSTWIWIQRGTPWKLWVIPTAVVGVIG